MKIKLIGIVLLSLIATVAIAGWIHNVGSVERPGKTQWTLDPTEGTLWRRNYNGKEVYMVTTPRVYHNTFRYYTNNVAAAVSNSVHGFGYFTFDTNGDIMLLPDAQLPLTLYTNRKDPGGRYDVEFEMNSDGNITPKL